MRIIRFCPSPSAPKEEEEKEEEEEEEEEEEKKGRIEEPKQERNFKVFLFIIRFGA